MYVCTYACMHVCMYECMYVRMYVRMLRVRIDMHASCYCAQYLVESDNVHSDRQIAATYIHT